MLGNNMHIRELRRERIALMLEVDADAVVAELGITTEQLLGKFPRESSMLLD